MKSIFTEIESHITAAEQRYGDFASTHEAMGVALEEWDELREAIKSNRMEQVRRECIDLAAVLVRLAHEARHSPALLHRSIK